MSINTILLSVDSFMTMLCYQNGSLTREFIRDQYANGDWKTFNSLLGQTSPGNMNQVGFYFTRPEITPNLATPGIWRFDANGKLLKNCNEIPFDPPVRRCSLFYDYQHLSKWFHQCNY